jgi:hypothetical protein
MGPQKMVALIEKLGRNGDITCEAVRKETAKPTAGRPKAFVFRYKAHYQSVQVATALYKSRVDRRDELVALQEIIKRAAGAVVTSFAPRDSLFATVQAKEHRWCRQVGESGGWRVEARKPEATSQIARSQKPAAWRAPRGTS